MTPEGVVEGVAGKKTDGKHEDQCRVRLVQKGVGLNDPPFPGKDSSCLALEDSDVEDISRLRFLQTEEHHFVQMLLCTPLFLSNEVKVFTVFTKLSCDA
jgi:hypothetical protein